MEISAILMGQRVRAARKMKQMSTDELAERVGVAAGVPHRNRRQVLR